MSVEIPRAVLTRSHSEECLKVNLIQETYQASMQISIRKADVECMS